MSILVIVITAGAGFVVLGAGLLWRLRRRYLVVAVSGSSMEPTLSPGQRLLVRRVPAVAVRRGQIVVLRDNVPTQWVIKRVVAAPGDPIPRDQIPVLRSVTEHTVPPGKLVLLGDNADYSVDSRHYGYASAEQLLGVMVRRIASA